MSSTSSSAHCAVQLVASQLERTIRIAEEVPDGPASPRGPGGPAAPASPFSPCGPFPQPTRPRHNVAAINARYRYIALPQWVAFLAPFIEQDLCRLPTTPPELTASSFFSSLITGLDHRLGSQAWRQEIRRERRRLPRTAIAGRHDRVNFSLAREPSRAR
jgi:hypothetical protein